MKKKRIRRIRRITALATGLLCILLGLASHYMLNYALSPAPGRGDIETSYQAFFRRVPELKPWVDSLQTRGLLRDTFVVMPSGEIHHALYLRARQAQGRTAILIHGYRDNALSLLRLGRMYHETMRYNILLPDLHAHGCSEGEAIGMGWNERHDLLHWIEVAEDLFHSHVRPCAMVLHGVSMGAATAMNVSGEELPHYVRAFVADCGYTSVWDEFSGQLWQQFGLPAFPLLYTTDLLCRGRYGWSFRQASPLQQVKRSYLPMFFIHGESDTFVPTEMVHRLYAAKPDPKQLWIVPHTRHADSYTNFPQEYTRQVFEFLSYYME